MLVLFFTVFLSPVSAAGVLTCSPANIICPGSPVTCECINARDYLRWIVTSSVGTELLTNTYHSGSLGGSTTYDNFTVVNGMMTPWGSSFIFTSRLNFIFSEDVNVICTDSIGTKSNTFHTANSPSPLESLQLTLNITATEGVDMRLDWDLLKDDGRVDYTHYQVFVNESEQEIMYTPDTKDTANSTNTTNTTNTTTSATTAFTLNATGDHLVQVRAVNCVGTRNQTSITINTMNMSSDVLNTAAVVGMAISLFVVIVMVFTCGVLIGLLVKKCWRIRPSTHTSESCQIPMHEKVISSRILLKENISYGQFTDS